ncbi:cytochrome P450 [Streptomyces sp. SID13031]|uniref:cytochrome P450 n=1 Tax=Streptomyces sp. SID13031 TaxID=2706046 RepID=UPI0013CD0A4A|nr:cytochrome P450 [Streptomyces sp. SID13031]NEA34117.1 cytochrome P450 [Streptomyces sp. SID13031]
MTTAADQVLKGLFSEAGLDDPYRYYAELHKLGPVSLLEGGAGYAAVVTGYEAADQLLRDPRFLVADDVFSDELSGPEWREHPLLTVLNNSMMYSNGPRHTQARRLFQQVFTPRRVAELEPAVGRLVDGLMDQLAERLAVDGEADFMSEFAYPLPSSVVAALLGIPQADLTWFRPRVERINDFLDVVGKTDEVLAAADQATRELSEYYRTLIAERRKAPSDDLISQLVEAVDAGLHEVSDDDLICNLLVLFNASFVTTIHLIGNGMWMLLDQPELRTAAATPAFVEEVLRYEAPVQFVARWSEVEASLAGTVIPPKEIVLVVLGAANRDSERYPDPDAFDARRVDVKPLSFGAGPHYCLGAALARAEARIAFPRLLERFPSLRSARPPVRNPQQFLRGYKSMPVAT